MLRCFLHRHLRRFEAEFDYDMDYGHELLDISPGAFLRFARIMGMANYRQDIPAAPYYAAKLVATLAEDCGPCTQLVVTMAEREQVPTTTLRAIVTGDVAAMDTDTALARRYAVAVLAHDPEAEPLRQQIHERWGARAVASLALTIASSRVFPTLKYALGHGQACAQLRIGDAAVGVAPRSPAT